jgi:hypothetical protein
MLWKQTGFKKKLTESVSYSQRLEMVKIACGISKTRQTELLHISKSSLYYEVIYSADNLEIMNTIDEIYTEHSYY